MRIGPVTLHNKVVAVMDLSEPTPKPFFGARLAGLLGYPFFAHTVVEIDYQAESVACYDSATYHLRAGEWQPITWKGRLPTLAARFEGGLTGQFILDTGSTLAVTFHAPFVQEHALLANRTVTPSTNVGTYGVAAVRMGQIAWFETAGRRWERPTVAFGLPNPHEPTPADVAGTIGQELLRNFVVVLDFSASRIALLSK